jgi:hypothetical protein
MVFPGCRDGVRLARKWLAAARGSETTSESLLRVEKHVLECFFIGLEKNSQSTYGRVAIDCTQYFVYCHIWQSTSSTFNHIAIQSTENRQQSVNILTYAINLPKFVSFVNNHAISDHMHDLAVNMMTIFTANY